MKVVDGAASWAQRRSISRGTAVTRRRYENGWVVPSSALGSGYVPSCAMSRPNPARSWVRASRSDRRLDHWVFCCTGVYKSGLPRAMALAKTTRSLST